MSVYLWTKQHLTHQKWLKIRSFWYIRLSNVLRATTACTFSTSNDDRLVKKCSGVIFDMFTQNVLRATTACTARTFFNISTSKSRPKLRRFVHFDFHMCFTPQRATGARTFFHISTSKSGPGMVCFDTFGFRMCFAPQRRATFHLSSGQLPPHPPL